MSSKLKHLAIQNFQSSENTPESTDGKFQKSVHSSYFSQLGTKFRLLLEKLLRKFQELNWDAGCFYLEMAPAQNCIFPKHYFRITFTSSYFYIVIPPQLTRTAFHYGVKHPELLSSCSMGFVSVLFFHEITSVSPGISRKAAELFTRVE